VSVGAPSRTALAVQRLFFALWPAPELAEALHRQAVALARACGGRAPTRDNLHLTLAFLGDQPDSALEALAGCGVAAAAPGAPFSFTLDTLGYWKRNQLLWAGCSAVPEALTTLAATLQAGLVVAGFPLERRAFAPHVTLVRHAVGAPEGTLAAEWKVSALCLVASVRSHHGADYQVLREFPLGRP